MKRGEPYRPVSGAANPGGAHRAALGRLSSADLVRVGEIKATAIRDCLMDETAALEMALAIVTGRS